MMGYTNTHQRNFMRLISKSALLYTEMVVSSTILHTNQLDAHLGANFEEEQPVILQLGGADPNQLAEAARVAQRYGYQRFNLNVGCPSDRVSGSGCFGASLMRTPELVADICRSIAERTSIMPSVKCRIGVDDNDSYSHLASFVDTVSRQGGVTQFIVHARKAVLDPSWSPLKNRTIPPLKYEYVHQLRAEFPDLYLGINGGIRSLEEISSQLDQGGVEEVMVGRGVIDNPFVYRHIDQLVSAPTSTVPVTRREVLLGYAAYLRRLELASFSTTPTISPTHVSRRSFLLAPVLNLFTGCHNGRLFRRLLSDKDPAPVPPGSFTPVSLSSLSAAEAILRASEVISTEDLDG
jgi:tRNA-dihydrouridine synthase A